MMKVRERKFFSKPRRYLRPPRRRLRFAVWLQVASAVFAGPPHLGNGKIGFARRCFFIYSSSRDPRNDADSYDRMCDLSSRLRYIETAANCLRNHCFLSLFPRPSKRGISCLSLEAHPISNDLSVPTSRTNQNLVGELSVTNYVSCRLHSTGSSDSLRCRPFLPISLPRKNYSLRRFVGDLYSRVDGRNKPPLISSK